MNVKCPKCGSSNVCEILYGMPTGEAHELAEQGKLILGGCDIIIDDLPQPDYGCLTSPARSWNCSSRMQRRRNPLKGHSLVCIPSMIFITMPGKRS